MKLSDKSVLVTGSAGSIGSELDVLLASVVRDYRGVDIATRSGNVMAGIGHVIDEVQPDVIFHLAAAKHAPVGEVEPYETAHLNIEGTRSVLEAAARHGSRVVLASTCKAVNPETAYGASKLIAERMTLNYVNGSVARFHNVVETQGNVFELWEEGWSDHFGCSYPVTDCWRFFITKDEALSLLLYAATAERGLYSFYGDKAQSMWQIASRLYGAENLEIVERRRGDRLIEPFSHEEETAVFFDGPIRRLAGPHAGA